MKVFDWAEQVIAARAARQMARKLRAGKPVGIRRVRTRRLGCG